MEGKVTIPSVVISEKVNGETIYCAFNFLGICGQGETRDKAISSLYDLTMGLIHYANTQNSKSKKYLSKSLKLKGTHGGSIIYNSFSIKLPPYLEKILWKGISYKLTGSPKSWSKYYYVELLVPTFK